MFLNGCQKRRRISCLRLIAYIPTCRRTECDAVTHYCCGVCPYNIRLTPFCVLLSMTRIEDGETAFAFLLAAEEMTPGTGVSFSPDSGGPWTATCRPQALALTSTHAGRVNGATPHMAAPRQEEFPGIVSMDSPESVDCHETHAGTISHARYIREVVKRALLTRRR